MRPLFQSLLNLCFVMLCQHQIYAGFGGEHDIDGCVEHFHVVAASYDEETHHYLSHDVGETLAIVPLGVDGRLTQYLAVLADYSWEGYKGFYDLYACAMVPDFEDFAEAIACDPCIENIVWAHPADSPALSIMQTSFPGLSLETMRFTFMRERLRRHIHDQMLAGVLLREGLQEVGAWLGDEHLLLAFAHYQEIRDKIYFYEDLEHLIKVQSSLEGEERSASYDEETKHKNTTFLTRLRALSSDAYQPISDYFSCVLAIVG
ncbi:hypothetical protein [Candidatus Hepatobacter penaei]|uniref:hypothetical protein n=1 Tax=Candidatus Hepatobacter penaei TaxID=1274402 RepID=UPI0004F2CBAC|nr:hypothetical protein [Candidatus Hepatobacter penaei]